MTRPDEIAALPNDQLISEFAREVLCRDRGVNNEPDLYIAELTRRLSTTSPGDAVRERDALNDVGMFFRVLRRSSGALLHGYTLEVTRADYDKARAGYDVLKAALAPAEKAVVSIQPMALSDGRTDYFVSIRCGDREVTPHVFREEYKAAYHVALYDWLLNGSGEEPDVVDFGPDDWPARVVAGDERAIDPLTDCMNVALLIENGCDEKFARRIVNQWNEKCRAATPTPPSEDVGRQLCAGGIDPGFDDCPKCGATDDEHCKYEAIQSAAHGGGTKGGEA